MPPKVSVVMPAYNCESFVGEAIDSVLNQTADVDLEILVVDDASTDKTKAVVDAMADKDPRVVSLSNARQKGVSGARNTGLENVTGDYVAFLDSDDLWCDNHLAVGIPFLETHPDIDVVFFNFDVVEFKTKSRLGDWFSAKAFSKELVTSELDAGFKLIEDNMMRALVGESFMHLQAMIVRKATLGSLLFKENLSRAEDRDLSVRLAITKKARFAYKDVVTGIYYRHEGSLTDKTEINGLAILENQIMLFEGYLSILELTSDVRGILHERLRNVYLESSYFYRKLHQYDRAWFCLKKSIGYGSQKGQLVECAKILVSQGRHLIQR